MNSRTTIEVALLVTLIGCFIAIYNFMVARKKEALEEAKEAEANREALLKANIKLDQICTTTNETRTDVKAMDKKFQEVDKRVMILERDNEALWKRVDELAARSETV